MALREKKNQNIKIKHSRAKFQFSKRFFSCESDPLGVSEKTHRLGKGTLRLEFGSGHSANPGLTSQAGGFRTLRQGTANIFTI